MSVTTQEEMLQRDIDKIAKVCEVEPPFLVSITCADGIQKDLMVRHSDVIHDAVRAGLGTKATLQVHFGSYDVGSKETFGDHGMEDGARLSVVASARGGRVWFTPYVPAPAAGRHAGGTP